MSETIKTADNAKKPADMAARSGQAAVDAAGKATIGILDETGHVVRSVNERARTAGQGMTETLAETVHKATDLSSDAAEQGREDLMMGMRTAAGVGGQVADIGLARGHHMMASAAQAMDIYRDASERSAERVQALFSSVTTLGRGLQGMQQAWLQIVDQSIENASRRPRDLLRCKNMVEVAEVQRDLYIDAVNRVFESTSRLLELAGRTAQDAVRPLQLHVR